MLNQENPQARNAAALTFRIYRFNAAAGPLFRAVHKPENFKSRGTLVYALGKLNCSHHLGELFSILFGAAGNWEVQVHVLSILDEQTFSFTKEELQKIKSEWYSIQNEWNELNNIDENNIRKIEFDRILIQSFVDDYLIYL
ncbi:hypothetical protein GCM10027348_19730 [Hymenobacter tenuis]